MERNKTLKPRRRWLKALGIVGIVLVVLAAAALVYSNVPNEFTPLPEAVSAESRERNTLIATSLVVGGIHDAFVDVTPERAYVNYEAPNGTSPESSRFLQDFVLGAAARGAPDSETAFIVQTSNGTALLAWEVPMASVHAYVAGTITEQAFRAAIKETTGATATP